MCYAFVWGGVCSVVAAVVVFRCVLCLCRAVVRVLLVHDVCAVGAVCCFCVSRRFVYVR